MKNLNFFKILSIISFIGFSSLQAGDLYIKNGTKEDITIHLKAAHKNKAKQTRHDEATPTITPGNIYKFHTKGELQDFSVIKPTEQKDLIRKGLALAPDMDIEIFRIKNSEYLANVRYRK